MPAAPAAARRKGDIAGGAATVGAGAVKPRRVGGPGSTRGYGDGSCDQSVLAGDRDLPSCQRAVNGDVEECGDFKLAGGTGACYSARCFEDEASVTDDLEVCIDCPWCVDQAGGGRASRIAKEDVASAFSAQVNTPGAYITV